jgi:hypothetical protein
LNIESFANDPLVSIGSLVLAVLGIILAIFFYIRSQRNKVPCFDTSSSTIIEGLHKALDGLEVTYKGATQERITISKVIFWNECKDTIDKHDLVMQDPLRIVCPKDIEILDIQVISDNVKLNSIILEKQVVEKDIIYYPVSFEYLDHEEYIIIQIIHNGDTSGKFSVAGKIKGVKSITKVSEVKPPAKIFKYLPFISPYEKILSSPIFYKYIGSLLYFSAAMYAVWNLFVGNTQWYVWLAIPILLFFSGVMYFGFRYISPVKI